MILPYLTVSHVSDRTLLNTIDHEWIMTPATHTAHITTIHALTLHFLTYVPAGCMRDKSVTSSSHTSGSHPFYEDRIFYEHCCQDIRLCKKLNQLVSRVKHLARLPLQCRTILPLEKFPQVYSWEISWYQWQARRYAYRYLKTAILMAVSTDCTLAGAKSWLEEERPYIRALNAAVWRVKRQEVRSGIN